MQAIHLVVLAMIFKQCINRFGNFNNTTSGDRNGSRLSNKSNQLAKETFEKNKKYHDKHTNIERNDGKHHDRKILSQILC